MKRLYLARHAKSFWECVWLSDFERPLSERGKRDAPKMGQVFRQKGWIPQLIVSSPATRAYTTARIFSEQVGCQPSEIRLIEEIYDALTRDLLKVIGSIEESVQSLMLFGHNPAMTSVANKLTNAGIENLPTCGIVVVDFEVDSWEKVIDSIGKLVAFEYPKKYSVT